MARPMPIRTDTTNAFANNTMRVRVPAIIRETIRLNPDYPSDILNRLETLAVEVERGAPLPTIEAGHSGAEDWLAQLDHRKGDTWHSTEWFFAETYVYRCMMDAVNWWETGRDPFAPKKLEEINGAALWQTLSEARAVAESPELSTEEKLAALLEYDLWGNRIDLSYALAASHGAQWTSDDLLANDTEAVVWQIMTAKQVDFILDNAGTELAMDLVLADTLIRIGVERVILHAKYHPTFVSDTIPADIEFFRQLLGEKSIDLSEKLEIRADLFWNSPHFLWALSPESDLYQHLQQSDLVIVKGDANYRRIVGDAVWNPTVSFAEVVGYFPAPLAALRTLKSDPIVGLGEGTAEALDTVDPNWRVNGKRGVVQFKG